MEDTLYCCAKYRTQVTVHTGTIKNCVLYRQWPVANPLHIKKKKKKWEYIHILYHLTWKYQA